MVAILEHMSALSDPIRCRMLMLLEKQELTVTEIGAILQMPQSSVSRHLKTLADDNWVVSRRDGTSRFYAMSTGDELDPGAKRLWPIIKEQVAATSAAGQDDRRLRGVLARRRAKSQEFFASAAGDWDRLRSDLFGDTFYLWGVLGLMVFADPWVRRPKRPLHERHYPRSGAGGGGGGGGGGAGQASVARITDPSAHV